MDLLDMDFTKLFSDLQSVVNNYVRSEISQYCSEKCSLNLSDECIKCHMIEFTKRFM